MQIPNSLLALMAGVTVGYVVAGHPAIAAQPAPVYEYKKDSAFSHIDPDTDLNQIARVKEEAYQRALNEMAAQGWEPVLVLSTSRDEALNTLLFRRLKR